MTRLGDILRSLADKADGHDEQLGALESGLSAATAGKVLWEGALWPDDTQTATLSERATAQPHGVVLVYCGYDPGTSAFTNTNLALEFVPKALMARWFELGFQRVGITTLMLRSGAMVPKTVYVHDDKVTGHAANQYTSYGSNGNTVNNRNFALRFVIGV